MKTTRASTWIALSLLVGSPITSLQAWQNSVLPSSSKPQSSEDHRLDWWRAARFGMFVHWGPVSLRGTEIGWSRGDQVPVAEYDQLYQRFNPTNFDARAWAKLAKSSGMKYLVLTTKHHDGFCLWDTKLTSYNIMNTPFHRDVVKELAAACRQEGIVFCAYHSICDWHHPDYPLGSPGGRTPKPAPNMDRYNQYLKQQLAELIQGYGPLGILWFDGEWEKPWSEARGKDLYQWMRSLQPGIIVNNRVGNGRTGMAGATATGAFAGDYDTPEQEVGKFQNQWPWESCITLCNQWAWKPNDPMKSLQQCLRTLIFCAGGDGNLLFNVGPMPNGEIEPRQVERLNEMGRWLKQYGHTIYATRGGPFKPGKWGASTCAGNTVYLHVFEWPDQELALPSIPGKITSVKVLTGGRAQITRTARGITLSVPPKFRQAIDTIIQLKLDRSATNIPPVSVTGSLAGDKAATASNVFQNQPGYAPGKAFDGDPGSRWATDAGTRSAWIEVDLGRPETISRAVIDEWAPGGKRIQSFELQYQAGGAWRKFHQGATVGANCAIKFPPITAQRVRLQILDATDGPTINEFELLAK